MHSSFQGFKVVHNICNCFHWSLVASMEAPLCMDFTVTLFRLKLFQGRLSFWIGILLFGLHITYEVYSNEGEF